VCRGREGSPRTFHGFSASVHELGAVLQHRPELTSLKAFHRLAKVLLERISGKRRIDSAKVEHEHHAQLRLGSSANPAGRLIAGDHAPDIVIDRAASR